MPYPIRVEGHTDNVPIYTKRFPSNWELSTVRAVNVLKYFADAGGIDPRRLSAVGYGESKPLVANISPQSRAKNRRVEIVLIKEDL
jgi:chemotaxis protein MotB